MMGRSFFDAVAADWDRISPHDPAKLERILALGGPREGDRVLDLGCGTGVLFGQLLDRIGPEGRLDALDLSEAMLAVAATKVRDPRLRLIQADVLEFDNPGAYDSLVAYSCLPHLGSPGSLFRRAALLLRRGGLLLIAHSEGRERINAGHRRLAEGPSFFDLPPIEELVREGRTGGFLPLAALDEEELYVYVATKGAAEAAPTR